MANLSIELICTLVKKQKKKLIHLGGGYRFFTRRGEFSELKNDTFGWEVLEFWGK